ncbi:LysR family transcriptional regulator [Streptomyces griseus]|uniref:LysR family transcriptional regulator n=1 Tax=Streptomyces griseus TaxID=1911 RepID=UPI0007C710E7|nr:LysR family transcriptional regulator [Streptomyces griseus]
MGIELHHLRGFLAVAEERHFTRAAKRMDVSQPTLSRTMRRLEDGLGRRLLERTTRQVTLTSDGEALYEQLSVLMPRLEAVLWPEEEDEAFRVGFAWGFPSPWPQVAIARFEAETGLSVSVQRHDAKLGGVDRGYADVAVLRGRVAAPPGMQSTTLLHERRIVAVSTRSELAGREEMSWQEIADHHLVLNEVSGTTNLDDWPAGRRPDVAVVCRNFDEWLEAVAANKGLGVVPEFVGRQHIHTFVSFLEIPDAPMVPLQLVYPEHGGHPKVGRFVEMAQEAVEHRV